jgi:hypothetical protein
MRRIPVKKIQIFIELLCKTPDIKPYPPGHVGHINYNPPAPVIKYPYGQK